MAHVGRADVGHQRTIVEPDQRVNQAFGVHDGFNLVTANAEKLLGFNKFKRLVEHGRAVDRDPLAHVPIGMARGLRHRYIIKPVQRMIAKGTTAGGDDNAFHRGDILADQRLKDARMFTVNRQNACAVIRCALHKDRAGGDQRFLVGQSKRRPVFQCLQSRRQASRPDNGRHDPISGSACRLLQGARATCRHNAATGQRIAQRAVLVFIGNHCNFGLQGYGIIG